MLTNGVYSTDGNARANYDNGLPSATNPLILDGTNAATNEPITFNTSINVGSITLQNGYNNVLTIKFLANPLTNATNIINNGCTLTINSYDNQGIALTNGNKFEVLAGGTLILKDPTGATTGGGYFYSTQPVGTVGDYLDNEGTVTWTGTPVGSGTAFTDTISVPVISHGTNATFKFDGGSSTGIHGILKISGKDANNTNNVSYCQSNSATSSITNGATVIASSGWFSTTTAGNIIVGPAGGAQGSGCKISAGTSDNGDIDIAAGTITIGDATTTGSLTLGSSTVELDGTLNLDGKKTGGNSTLCDLFKCTGDLTVGADSVLTVGTIGTAGLGTGNRWSVVQYKSLAGTFKTITIPATMSKSIGPSDILVSN